MSGRRLVTGFLIFLVLFVAALVWAQFFAFYHRVEGVEALTVAGTRVPVTAYEGIDSDSSPLKLRGCMRLDPAAVADLPPAPEATPLVAPFWFGCFDAGELTGDLERGAARAVAVARDEPEGFDEMLAVYPDGRAFLWRQLGPGFEG